MLIAFSQIKGTSVDGVDDHQGSLSDLVFDGDSFVVRYAVIDTGKWLPGREIPIQPTALIEHDWPGRSARTNLLRTTLEESPVVDSALPVSRKMEIELAQHFNWPEYWAVDPIYGVMPPIGPTSVATETKFDLESHQVNLRSAREVMHYSIHETDGELGSVHELIVDDESWVVRFFVVDTGNWLPGKKVMISTSRVKRISWSEGMIHVDMTKSEVEECPHYDSHEVINRRHDEQFGDLHHRAK